MDAARLTIAARSGRVKVEARPGATFAVEGARVTTEADGSLRLDGGSSTVTVRCAEGTDVSIGTFSGRVGVQSFFEKLLGAVEFTSFAPRTFLDDGDTVVVLGHDTGVAIPTGRPYDVEWVQVMVVKGGRIASFSEYLQSAPVEAAFGKH